MCYSLRGWGILCAIALVLSAAIPAPGAGPDDKLSEFDFLLVGLSPHPDPEFQTVPRNTPTGLRVVLSVAGVDESALVAFLGGDIEVVAEIVGPGIDATPLRGPPGELLPIPPLAQAGLFLVRDIRLEKNGKLFLRATPDTATVEVIDRILVTQVTTRPLTLDEIRQKGILIGEDNFTGFNFSLAMRLDSRPVTLDFDVVFDENDIPIPTRPTGGLQIRGPSLPVNIDLVPLMLKVELPDSEIVAVTEFLPDVSIPGLLVIPGDVGFLDEFFSAVLLVSNGAPEGSGLSVHDLSATITLPIGKDGVPESGDEPLVVAETGSGRAMTLPILGVGPDGIELTGDDTTRFGPGEQGQAEFLLEGKKEGFHEIAFDIEGTLDGLPIGPVPVVGQARGGVVVRNKNFNLTFTAPATVRRGEEFTLLISVTNTSDAAANLVYVAIDDTQLIGATLALGEDDRKLIETIGPRETELLRFRFDSNQTGQVTASYLEVGGDGNTGDLRFRLGVGERGVPLSPDTIILPASLLELPQAIVDAGYRVIGLAWSVSTAPSGTLPDGVLRASKDAVIDHALELAEAGFRAQLGESLESALESLLFSWLSSEDAGFEQILRDTSAGGQLFEAIGNVFAPSGFVGDFHRDVATAFSGRASHVIVGFGDGTGAAPITFEVADSDGRVLDPAGASSLPNAARIPLASADVLGRDLAVLTQLQSSLYIASFTATDRGSLDLSATIPRPNDVPAFYDFAPVALDVGMRGRLTLDLLQSRAALKLELDRDGDGFFEESVDSESAAPIHPPEPVLLSATAIGPETLSDADPWGRVVALLFDRELRDDSVDDPRSYTIEDNDVRAASLQLSGRLVTLFLEQPVGNLVPRDVAVSGLIDTSGRRLSLTTRPIVSRIPDAGAIVSGRVLEADGRPLTGAEVLYINRVRGGDLGVAQQIVGLDGRYQFDYVRQSPYGPFGIRALDLATGRLQTLSTRVSFNGEHIVADLVLRGQGGVTGIVSDAAGPVPDARVLVTSGADPATFALVDTDGEGRYVATDIVVGPVAVKAVKDTFAGVASGLVQRAGTFATVDVSLNASTGSVTVTVSELEGEATPIDQVDVYYMLPRPVADIVVATGKTLANGTFTFKEVPTGRFRIVAIDPIRSRSASSITSTLTAETPNINVAVFFAVEDLGTISGIVQTAKGTPAAGALVKAAGQQVLTDVAGNFSFINVAPGTYAVSAQSNASSAIARRTVELPPGGAVDVSFVLAGTGQVLVTVKDPAGANIAGLTVLQSTGCSGVGETTDASGVAIFDGIEFPGASFKAVRDGEVVSGSATIRSAGAVAGLVLQFSGKGVVRGTVRDSDGNLASGAGVVLGATRFDSFGCSMSFSASVRQVSTGVDGTFLFEGVDVGMVTVTATKDEATDSASARLVRNGDIADVELTFTTEPLGRLEGTVFLPDGETPAGAGVSVTVFAFGEAPVTVATDDEGRYRTAKILRSGRYTLTAIDPVTNRTSQIVVFLDGDQDITTDLRLFARGTVTVRVVDGSGDPVDEAFVELEGADYPFDIAASHVTSVDDGFVKFERITEGRFTVTASDALGRGGRANGSVDREGSSEPVDVFLTPVGTVRGVFQTSEGDPIPNGEIRLRRGTTGSLLGSVATSSAPNTLGQFSFELVPAGTFLATATDPLTGRIGEASGRIEDDGEIVDLVIEQLGLGSVSGIVTSGGAPEAAIIVDLVSKTGLSTQSANLRASATTHPDGTFMFDGVPVGSFTVSAKLPGALLTGSASGSIDRDGDKVEDVEIALTPSGTVEGNVLRADGTTRVPGAQVDVTSSGGRQVTEADASGFYRLALVPAGELTVLAAEPSSEGRDAGEASATLEAEGTASVDVRLNGVGTISGTALDADGNPLDRGTVRLNRPAPFPREETASVAPDGSFQFFEVPVGEFTLSLTVTGSLLKGTAFGSVSTDGEDLPVTIRLQESGEVIGNLVKPDGVGGQVAAANVVVRLTGTGFTLTALSDANGDFEIDAVPFGDFSLVATDPVNDGLAKASGATSLENKLVDLGTLVLDADPIAIESISPSPGATDVPPDKTIVIRFTDPVDEGSITSYFSVRTGATTVAGTRAVSPDGLELVFTPQRLDANTTYDVSIGKKLPDILGRPLGEDFQSSFTTGQAVVTGTIFLGSLPVSAGVDVLLTVGAETRSTQTNAGGSYRFASVPAGGATIQAVDAASGRSASAFVDISATEGVRVADLALRLTGSVQGRVFLADGSPAGAGLEVRLSLGSTKLAQVLTDDAGFYTVSHIDAGNITVDVTNLANADRGRSEGTVVVPGPPLTVDVTMIGVGSVRLFVKTTSGDDVPGATTTLTFSRFRQSTTLSNNVPEPDASFFYPVVLAGDVDADAVDPATGLIATGESTLAPGQDLELTIFIEATGTIAGTVVEADGVTLVAGATVTLRRGTAIGNLGEVVTDGTGGFLFELVKVDSSPFRLEVHVDGQLRARETGIDVEDGVETNVTLTLVGLGTVTGDLQLPSGATFSSKAVVELTSRNGEVGGKFSTKELTGDRYRIDNVPIGAFLITATDVTSGLFGEAEGAVTTSAEVVELDIALVSNAMTFPVSLHDANNTLYRVQKGGDTSQGEKSLWVGAQSNALFLDLTMEGATTRYEGSITGAGREEDGGREVTALPVDIDGIRASRKIFVPRQSYFARYLEILENVSGDTATFTVSVSSNIRFGELIDSGSGDAELDPDLDDWLVVDSAQNAFPAFAVHGAGGVVRASDIRFELVGSSHARLTVDYELTLEDGERTVLMHFVSQQLSAEGGAEAGRRLSGLAPEVLSGLSLDEIRDIRNFDVPEDGFSSIEPHPAVDGRVTGQLLAWDGVHGIGEASGMPSFNVELRSRHVLFGRLRLAKIDQDGLYDFKSAFTDTSSLAVPHFGFQLEARTGIGNAVSATLDREFVGVVDITRSSRSVVSASSFLSAHKPTEPIDRRRDDVFWEPAASDPAPVWEVTSPEPVKMSRVWFFPSTSAVLDGYTVELFGSSGEILDTRSGALGLENDEIIVDFVPPVAGVHKVALRFTGSTIRIRHIRMRATASTDFAPPAADLVFAGTASIKGQMQRASGEGVTVTTTLQMKVGAASKIAQPAAVDDQGRFFLAPFNAGGPVTLSAALFSQPGVKTEAVVDPLADTTHTQNLVLPPTATLSGQVFAPGGASGQPNFFIAFFPEEGSSKSGRTDGSGFFLFEDVPSGNHVLRIFDAGANAFRFQSVIVTAPTPATASFQLATAATIRVEVSFETLDGSSAFVHGATVFLQDALDTEIKSVGVTHGGFLEIKNVASPFTLQIQHPTNTASLTPHFGVIPVHGVALTVPVTIPSFGSVTGVVTLGDGSTPAVGAAVELSSADHPTQSTATDVDGSYTFATVRAARGFNVTARHPAPNREHVARTEASPGIAGEGASVAVNVTLPATGTVNVRVVEEDLTTGVAGVEISINGRLEGTTDGSGDLVVPFVPVGAFTADAFQDGHPVGTPQVGTIAADGDTVDITFVRDADATISGFVFAIDGQTAPPATVQLFEGTTRLAGPIATDAGGAFDFQNAGRAGDGRTVRATFSDNTSRFVEETVAITEPGQVFDLTLTLPVSVITGRILDADAATPIPEAYVEINRQAASDFRFDFFFAETDGSYAIFDEAPGTFEIYTEDDFFLSRFVRVDLPEDTQSLVQDITLPPSGTVEGTVMDAQGNPVAFPYVVLRNDNIFFYQDTTGDANGNFRFDRIAEGSFSVTFTDTVGGLSATTVARVVANELTNVVLTLPARGTVFGQLREAGGPTAPSSGTVVHVELRDQESEPEFDDAPRIYTEDAPIAPDGSYRVEDTSTGEMTVTIEDGAATGVVTDAVEAEIDVTLGSAELFPSLLVPDPEIGGDGFTHIDQAANLRGLEEFSGVVVSSHRLILGELFINDKLYPELASATRDVATGELTIGPARLAGVDVTRRFRQSADGLVIRYLDILENPHPFEVELMYRVENWGVYVSDTSTGQRLIGFSDRYFATDRDDSSVALVFAGTTAGAVGPSSLRDFAGENVDLEWRTVRIPASGRVILMHFAVQGPDVLTVLDRAERTSELVDEELYGDLSAEERRDILNFEPQQP